MNTLLETKNLTVQFKTSNKIITAIEDVNAKIEKNKITAVIGESGSGKSVLGNAIMGLMPKNSRMSGEIIFNGKNLTQFSEKNYENIRGKDIAWIAQNPLSALNSAWNINELISESALYHKQINANHKQNFAKNLLDKLHLDNNLLKKYSFELSGGMAQRVLIATGIGLFPKLLIMDEPTKGLDSKNINAIEKIILDLVSEGVTILLITHDLEFAERVADNIMVIYEAEIVEKSDANSFFTMPKQEYCRALLQSTPKNGMNVINNTNSSIDFNGYFELAQNQSENLKSEPIIRFDNVSKSYKKGLLAKEVKSVFKNISFNINSGEICGLFGASGCGKSTTLRLFMELTPFDSGSIFYNNKNISSYTKTQKKLIRKDVQIVFQDPNDAFHPKWRIRKSLMEPLKLFGEYNSDNFESSVSNYLEMLGLDYDFLDRYPYQLSGGQIQRLAFLRVLLLKPKCIFLDEATSMLDVSVQAQFMNIVKKLNQLTNTTFVIISHDKELVKHMCDRIYVFENSSLTLKMPDEII